MVVAADGSGAPRALAEITGHQQPADLRGPRHRLVARLASAIAFVSATPGPETELATGDPVVITRYLYKPDAAEGNTRFNDNRRRHIFVVDAGGRDRRARSRRARTEEHSIDWSPDGRGDRSSSPTASRTPTSSTTRISSRSPSPTASIRRLTATESAEYQPRWSPDGRSVAFMGTRRGLTDLETTMEDTHVWVDERGRQRPPRAGRGRRQPPGVARVVAGRRAGSTSPSRSAGTSASTGCPRPAARRRSWSAIPARVESWSVGRRRRARVRLREPERPRPALSARRGRSAAQAHRPQRRASCATSRSRRSSPSRSVSNDFKFDVEAYLTQPGRADRGLEAPDDRDDPRRTARGAGPGLQLPVAALRAAAAGPTLHGELPRLDRLRPGLRRRGLRRPERERGAGRAVRRERGPAPQPLDRPRPPRRRGRQLRRPAHAPGSSRRRHIFKAAIPLAPIINNLSYNYMTYYNMYEQMEWGVLPHQGNLMDVLWERSALKHVAKVKTPDHARPRRERQRRAHRRVRAVLHRAQGRGRARA